MRFVTTRSTTGFHRVEFASQAALDARVTEGGSYHAVMVVGGFSTLAKAGRFDGHESFPHSTPHRAFRLAAGQGSVPRDWLPAAMACRSSRAIVEPYQPLVVGDRHRSVFRRVDRRVPREVGQRRVQLLGPGQAPVPRPLRVALPGLATTFGFSQGCHKIGQEQRSVECL